MDKTEVMVRQESSPAEMISMAVKGGADLEQLEKLLALQERWEANEARKAYHQAMANFKTNPPKIAKNKKVGYSTSKGNVSYSHATLANVVEQITKELSRHGLSASWNTKQNGAIAVTCKITHAKGHSEEVTLMAGADDTGSKNSIQALGSTITYLERYTLLAATGLATHDQDDDARMAEKISEKEMHAIRDQLIDAEIDETKFTVFMKVEKLEDILKTDFNKAVNAIAERKKAKEASKKSEAKK